jgi:hypothetical protein
MTQPNNIISCQLLGTIDPPESNLYQVAVYYLKYYSATCGGVTIASKLFIPMGKSPATGWKMSVWCHGMGDPASDFRRYPFVGNDWNNTRGMLTGKWAHHGYVTLTPWLPGAGESEPLMSFSPFSLEKNAQAVADGFLALRNIPQYFADNYNLTEGLNLEINFDFERQVLRTDCVSTPLLVYFASHLKDFPATGGIKALVADDFQPSLAYNGFYLIPYLKQLPPRLCCAMRCLGIRTWWQYVKENNWELTEFLSPSAIALFSEQVDTPVGKRDRLLASQLVPPQRSEIAPLLESAVTFTLGKTPTGEEIFTWLYSQNFLDWFNLRDLKAMVNDPFYQQYFAQADPFFEENINPFNPNLPLIIVAKSGEKSVAVRGLPSFDQRFENMTLPKINTLINWGWNIDIVKLDPQGGTSFSGGKAQTLVLNKLANILDDSTLNFSFVRNSG